MNNQRFFLKLLCCWLLSLCLNACNQPDNGNASQQAQADSASCCPGRASIEQIQEDSVLYTAYRSLFPELTLPLVLTSEGLDAYWQGSVQRTIAFLNSHPQQIHKKYSRYLACSVDSVFAKDYIPEQWVRDDNYVIDDVYIPYGRVARSEGEDAFIVIYYRSSLDRYLQHGPVYKLYICSKWSGQPLHTTTECYNLHAYLRGQVYPQSIRLFRQWDMLAYQTIDNRLDGQQQVVRTDTTLVFFAQKGGGVQDYSSTVSPPPSEEE